MPIFWFCLLAVLVLARRGKEEEKHVEGRRRRQGSRADIPVTVQQVPAGEVGGPGAFQTSKRRRRRRRWRGKGGMRRRYSMAWWWRRS